MTDAHASVRLWARCSDLSLQGCYVDTMNPFPVGTVVRVELRTTNEVFRTIACVSSSHVAMGMGLRFQDPPPEQVAVLVGWLNSRPDGRKWTEQRLGAGKQSDTLERTLAKNLVREMLNKGSLTKADLSEILFGPEAI